MNSAEQVKTFREKPLDQRQEQFKKFQNLHSGRIPVLISTRNSKIPLSKVKIKTKIVIMAFCY